MKMRIPKAKPVKKSSRNVEAISSIGAVAHYMHNTVARHCEYCGRPMTPSDVNDYGTLCERCYMKEYYND